MKIAFVFPPMWTPHSDGSTQIWNHEVTTRLLAASDVLVYSGIFEFPRHDCIDGVPYRRFSNHLDKRFLRRYQFIRRALGIQRLAFATDLWYAAYALKVALDLRKQDCDIVHIYYYPQFAALIKYLNPTVRIVLHMLGQFLTQVRFTNLYARLKKIDLILGCSDLVTNSIRDMFPQIAGRCRTIPMGLSPDAFSRPYQNSRAGNPHPRRLLYVGRISPEKGVHDLLDAFELISRQFPDASLAIVGEEIIEPPENIINLCLDRTTVSSLSPFYKDSYLMQLKHRLSPDTAKRVTFVGPVAHSDVPAYYGDADVYVNPSLYESFGMSIIEAMAAGVPVVATRGGAVPELISHGSTGLLVEPANPPGIAEAVMNLLRNAPLRASVSSVAHDKVLRRYSWQSICSSLIEMYEEVLARKADEAS
jgi:glycosyltransferase involved in cell wall biosynthesis